jgi:tetratricopeptide (TPR) repeat protein
MKRKTQPDVPINKGKRREIIISVCLVLVITFVSFLPSLKNDFINWDDNEYVTENITITDLSWENIKTIFSHFYMGHYHPLTLLSYSIEFEFHKLNPLIYHTTNLLLHLFNTLFVFWLIFMLKGEILTSLWVALLFGIHPLHVESVAWVSERKDLLYSFFFLDSLICYFYYRKTQGMNYYYLSIFLFILSLLSKSMAVTLPFILLIHDYLLDRKSDKKTLVEKIPFLFFALTFGIIALFAKAPAGKISQGSSATFFENLLTVSDILRSHLSKLILPNKLSCLYPLIKLGTYSWLYLLAMATILIGGVILSRYNKKIIFGLLFFFITILPVLPVKVFADRYTYIPYMGLFYIVGEGFSWLYHRKIEKAKIVKTSLLILFIAIIGTFSFLTWERCKVWKDSISLWSDVLKNYPDILIAYIDRGAAFLNKREFDKAISDYDHALDMNPNNEKVSSIYNNRGNAYAGKGLYDHAISDFTKALTINSKYELAYSNRGNTYFIKGQYHQALADFNKALEINPRYVEVYFNKALVLEQMGRIREAIEAYQRFIQDAPPQYAKHIRLARKKIKELSLQNPE